MEISFFEGSPQEWNQIISGLPQTHVMQTWEWGQVKSRFGWQPSCYLWKNDKGDNLAAALILTREMRISGIPTALRIQYIPKGPLLDWNNTELRQKVLMDIHSLAHRQKAIFIKVDPDILLADEMAGAQAGASSAAGTPIVQELEANGWHFSDDQIQFRNTVVLDLRPDLDLLLANMKQKTRYNIRLAERKGIVIKRSGNAGDWSLLFDMYAETASRDGFVIREKAYYDALWQTFSEKGMLEAFIAEVESEPVAAVVLLRFGKWAWYMHGMSRLAHREKMPNYLLQWEAMKTVKSLGVQFYDLWGAPDRLDESDPMWGVYRFKEGFGGEFIRHIGAWDLPVRRNLYYFYTKTLPRILDVMRWRRMRENRRMVG